MELPPVSHALTYIMGRNGGARRVKSVAKGLAAGLPVLYEGSIRPVPVRGRIGNAVQSRDVPSAVRGTDQAGATGQGWEGA